MSDLRHAQLERVTPLDVVTGQLVWGPATLIGAAGLAGLLADRRRRHARARSGCAARAGAPVGRRGRAAAHGASSALRTNTGELERLPQDCADMLGWEEQVREVARVYRSLPAPDRARTVIVAGNYGEAGALDFFGPRYGLPAVVSPTGSCWFFGPGTKPGEVVVTFGAGREDLAPLFDSVGAAGRVTRPWSVAEERDLTILVARGPHRTLREVWPSLAGRN